MDVFHTPGKIPHFDKKPLLIFDVQLLNFVDLIADGTEWLREYVLPQLQSKGQRISNEISNNASKPFQCVRCKKQYKHKSGLIRHVTYECLGSVRLFACSICPKKFKRKDILDRHMVLIHGTCTTNKTVDFC